MRWVIYIYSIEFGCYLVMVVYSGSLIEVK